MSEDKRFPMEDYHDVDTVELLKSGGLKPVQDGTYARGFTLIAPPTKIKPGTIKPEDITFFSRLPYNPASSMRELLNAWYLLEQAAPPKILERYAMFTHAFGRKA